MKTSRRPASTLSASIRGRAGPAPHRLRAFRALVVVGKAGLTPGTMVDGLQFTAATLSFHLKELTNAGFVT